MQSWCALILGSLMFLCMPLVAWSQEPPAATPAPTAPATDPPGPKQAAFNELYAQWKALLVQLHELKVQYVSANDQEKMKIRDQFDALVKKGEELEPKVSAAAEAAYAENPSAGREKEVEKFLLMTCGGSLKQEDYERAYRVAKMLLEGGVQEKQLWSLAGVAAFMTGHLDEADQYFKKAAALKVSPSIGDRSVDSRIAQFLDDPAVDKKAWADEQKIRAAEAKADDLPRVLLKTDVGDIEVELFENEAPEATANFITLVEKGFYDGLTFHRVLPGFMAQGGDPKGNGSGGPGYSIKCECYEKNARKHFRGSLSMAHAGRDTGGSQFFLTFIPTSFLDGRHTVFGRVIKGMDVLSKIQRIDPDSDKMGSKPRPTKIRKATVVRKRDHEYKFTKLPER